MLAVVVAWCCVLPGSPVKVTRVFVTCSSVRPDGKEAQDVATRIGFQDR